MTTSVTDNQPWGDVLRGYRQRTGLTQGQFIEQLSFLVAHIDSNDRSALEQIAVFDEAAIYFSGVLDSPTLSRLEKGSRSLNSRQRCIALIWGLNRLDVLDGLDEANTFLELAGHGNLTSAESGAVLGLVEPEANAGPDTKPATETAPESAAGSTSVAGDHPGTGGESGAPRRKLRSVLLAGGAVAMLAILAVAVTVNAGDGGGDAETQSDPAGPGLQSHVLLVDELQSATGELGNGQTLVGLHEQDQRGTSDIWPQFVKFLADDTGDYLGYRAYYLPEHIPTGSITGIRLQLHYRGPDYETSPWVWEVQQSDAAGLVRLGDNRDSLWWQDWTEASFAFPADGDGFDASRYLQDGQIWVSLSGSQAFDTLDVDYEALIVEWTEPVPN